MEQLARQPVDPVPRVGQHGHAHSLRPGRSRSDSPCERSRRASPVASWSSCSATAFEVVEVVDRDPATCWLPSAQDRRVHRSAVIANGFSTNRWQPAASAVQRDRKMSVRRRGDVQHVEPFGCAASSPVGISARTCMTQARVCSAISGSRSQTATSSARPMARICSTCPSAILPQPTRRPARHHRRRPQRGASDAASRRGSGRSRSETKRPGMPSSARRRTPPAGQPTAASPTATRARRRVPRPGSRRTAATRTLATRPIRGRAEPTRSTRRAAGAA